MVSNCSTDDIVYGYDTHYNDFGVNIGVFNRDNLGSKKFFNGIIDDVIISTSWWNENEIQNDYNRQPWS